MSEPVIAKKGPIVVELEPGDYGYRAYGRSTDQPFCNGPNKQTGFAAQKFTIDEKRRVRGDGRRHSGSQPSAAATTRI